MMIRVGAVMLAACLAVGCNCSECEKEKAAVPTSNEGNSVVTLSVGNMMCEEGCARTVQELLASQEGVLESKVDFPAKTATVSIEAGKFSPKGAIQALADAGYPAEVVASNVASN